MGTCPFAKTSDKSVPLKRINYKRCCHRTIVISAAQQTEEKSSFSFLQRILKHVKVMDI